jgi:leucyl aminopeptidase (aminopeptidase T)
MQPSDLVVLIQSSNFLLDAFRIRLHLFQKKLKVIEHTHLYRNTEDVWDVYINALEYDVAWYRGIGPKLKAKLETANELRIEAGEAVLTVTGGVESPKLNVGDYAGMENIGGTFPIGEVFTESKDFAQMNGAFRIYAYAGADFCINMHEPFRVEVKEGQIVSIAPDAPESFTKIVDLIKEYERPLIREIGFGLNRAITRERYLQDITAFERILGMHLSLGEKHSVYKKVGIPTHKTKFHVDLFPLVDRVFADGELIFANGAYL